MNRPISIINFERCYLGAFVIGIVNSALNWSDTRERMAAQEQVLGTWVLPLGVLVGFAITLLIWYFVARRASVVAKWIATVFLVLGWIGVLFALASGNYPHGLAGVLGITGTILQTIAIYLLFKPDAEAWFTGGPDLGRTFE